MKPLQRKENSPESIKYTHVEKGKLSVACPERDAEIVRKILGES